MLPVRDFPSDGVDLRLHPAQTRLPSRLPEKNNYLGVVINSLPDQNSQLIKHFNAAPAPMLCVGVLFLYFLSRTWYEDINTNN